VILLKMAKVLVPRIERLVLTEFPESERTIYSKGSKAVPSEVVAKYIENRYDSAPKSKREAEALGQGDYNELATSIPDFTIVPSGFPRRSAIIFGSVYPTRYFLCKAVQDVVSEKNLSYDEARKRSVKLLNVSLLELVEYHSRMHLIGQIRGDKVQGAGQVLAALSGGGVLASHLQSPNFLYQALYDETFEEIGISLTPENQTRFKIIVDESELGRMNIAATTTELSFDSILGSYEALSKEKIMAKQGLEVASLVLIPLEDIPYCTLDGSIGLRGLTCFTPTKSGLIISTEDKRIRPYSTAVLESLQNPKNLDFMLKA
jgi:8-oxo-dGTP pyrophosphatase MutT (NUDIX family)